MNEKLIEQALNSESMKKAKDGVWHALSHGYLSNPFTREITPEDVQKLIDSMYGIRSHEEQMAEDFLHTVEIRPEFLSAIQKPNQS